ARRANPTVQTMDARQFEPIAEGAVRRIPSLRHVRYEQQVNGIESFTPDGEFLLGPAPEVAGVWAACGFCAHGVSGAGGVGKVMADWIIHGDPGMDLSEMALGRFAGREMSRESIRRAAEKIYATY